MSLQDGLISYIYAESFALPYRDYELAEKLVLFVK